MRDDRLLADAYRRMVEAGIDPGDALRRRVGPMVHGRARAEAETSAHAEAKARAEAEARALDALVAQQCEPIRKLIEGGQVRLAVKGTVLVAIRCGALVGLEQRALGEIISSATVTSA